MSREEQRLSDGGLDGPWWTVLGWSLGQEGTFVD